MTVTTPERTLSGEHDVLLHEVAARAQQIRDTLAEDRWPGARVEALVDYLRYEVLDQAVHEERLLFPLVREGLADHRVRELVDDHIRLRDLAGRLADAGRAWPGDRDPGRLAALLTELTDELDRHVRAEQDALAPTTTSGIEPLRRPFHSHAWFSLTDGPVVDVDRLPRGFAVTALVERMVRMRPGEHLELRSGRPLTGLAAVVARRRMTADYGWTYQEEGPDRWCALLERRY